MWIVFSIHLSMIKKVQAASFLEHHQLNTWLDHCFRNGKICHGSWIYDSSCELRSLPGDSVASTDKGFYESDILKSQNHSQRQPCTQHKHIMHSRRLVRTKNQRCVANQIKREKRSTKGEPTTATHTFNSLNVSFTFFFVLCATYEGEASSTAGSLMFHCTFNSTIISANASLSNLNVSFPLTKTASASPSSEMQQKNWKKGLSRTQSPGWIFTPSRAMSLVALVFNSNPIGNAFCCR